MATMAGVSVVPLRDIHVGRVSIDPTLGLPVMPILGVDGKWLPVPAEVKGLDFGKLILELPTGRRSFPSGAVVMARGASERSFYDADPDLLEAVHGGDDHPSAVNVRPHQIIEKTRTKCASGHGELLLVAGWSLEDDNYWEPLVDDEPKLLLVWRRDAREKKELWVLSAHTDATCAVNELLAQAETYRFFIEPRKQRPNRDFQKRLVYAWETPFLREMRQPMSLEVCVGLVAQVWERLDLPGVPPTTLHKPWLRKTSKHKPSKNEIWLATWGLNAGITLHEVSHAVVTALGLETPSHGPQFVAVAMALYEAFGGIDSERMKARAVEMGVQFGNLTPEAELILERVQLQDAGPKLR
jgi:hypothetical protein